jgi:hypothetical protein
MLHAARSFKALVLAAVMVAAMAPVAAPAQVSFGAGIGVGISVNIGPPALPVYVQPPCPAPNYLWTPGYWGWGAAGYFWVPGTWVIAPRIGYLWTPGYWGYAGGAYGWHAGYWGPHIGFYGGINYGFGYGGVGYAGGGWSGNVFRYNTAVTNVNTTVVRNVYVNKTVVVNDYNTTYNRVSYNGGPSGVPAQPSADQQAVEQGPRLPMTPLQQQHVETASGDRNLLASVNRGRPGEAAVARPFSPQNRPANYTPVRAQDTAAARSAVVSASAQPPLPASGGRSQSVAPDAPRASAWGRFNQPATSADHQAPSYASQGSNRQPRPYQAPQSKQTQPQSQNYAQTWQQSQTYAPSGAHTQNRAHSPAPAHPQSRPYRQSQAAPQSQPHAPGAPKPVQQGADNGHGKP